MSCTLGLLMGPFHAQGTGGPPQGVDAGEVTGVTVTTSADSNGVTVPVNTPGTFTANATAGTPVPASGWSVTSGPAYQWNVTSPVTANPAKAAQTTITVPPYTAAGTYTLTINCVVTYQAVNDDGLTGSMSGNQSKAVTVYVIGGPISGDNDESYFCSTNDTSGFGHLSAAPNQPAGTTYSWSISGSAIYCDSKGNSTSPTGASAVYRGVNPGSTNPGDVKANVTYSLNGVSSKSPDYAITIHVPVSFTITSQTGPTKLLPPDPNAYGFDNQSITFRVLDGLGLPLKNAYWDESWSQPNGGGQPHAGGGPLDDQGNSHDDFSSHGENEPNDPNGDKILGPLTHSYSVTNTGGTGGNVGCPVKTYTNVYYYTYGMTGNGF